MSLKSLMVYLKRRSVTPVTREINAGVTSKPAWIGACTLVTPVTPDFVEGHEKLNFHDVLPEIIPPTVLHAEYRLYSRLTPPPEPTPEPQPTPEPSADPQDWRELAQAYNAHHFNCKPCQAAGRGERYGLRCGVGAALWLRYSDAATQPTVKPNQINREGKE